MGAAFGLLSLLISVGIILWLMVGTGYMGTVAKTNSQAKQQINVMSGKDPSGQMMAVDSLHTRVDRAGGKPKLLVSEVMRDGPMEQRYGVKPGDQIVEIGGLEFGANIDTRDAATDWLSTAYARNQPIVVVRAGQRVTLPTPEHVAAIAKRDREATAAAAAAGVPLPAPAAPATPPAGNGDDLSSLQRALDTIRTTPGQ